MSLIFLSMPINFISHIGFAKWPCCHVEFKNQEPSHSSPLYPLTFPQPSIDPPPQPPPFTTLGTTATTTTTPTPHSNPIYHPDAIGLRPPTSGLAFSRGAPRVDRRRLRPSGGKERCVRPGTSGFPPGLVGGRKTCSPPGRGYDYNSSGCGWLDTSVIVL